MGPSLSAFCHVPLGLYLSRQRREALLLRPNEFTGPASHHMPEVASTAFRCLIRYLESGPLVLSAYRRQPSDI